MAEPAFYYAYYKSHLTNSWRGLKACSNRDIEWFKLCITLQWIDQALGCADIQIAGFVLTHLSLKAFGNKSERNEMEKKFALIPEHGVPNLQLKC